MRQFVTEWAKYLKIHLIFFAIRELIDTINQLIGK